MKKLLIIIPIMMFVLIKGETSETGGKIPDLKLKLLDGKNTSIHTLLEDGPLLIDFWATWCKPCKKVMKHLNKYHNKYEKNGFKVLMVNQDTPRSVGKVKSYIRSQKYSFYVGLDPNQKIAKKLNGLIMPTIILIDTDGTILWRHQGYMPGEEAEIESRIQSAIGLSTNGSDNSP